MRSEPIHRPVPCCRSAVNTLTLLGNINSQRICTGSDNLKIATAANVNTVKTKIRVSVALQMLNSRAHLTEISYRSCCTKIRTRSTF